MTRHASSVGSNVLVGIFSILLKSSVSKCVDRNDLLNNLTILTAQRNTVMKEPEWSRSGPSANKAHCNRIQITIS